MNAGPDSPHAAGDSTVDAALLLAGGSGRRIGVDKRLLTLGGRPLVLRALDFLRDNFSRVAVSVSADRPLDLGPAGDEVVIVPDRWRGDSPLAGLASGLRALGAPVFALATDLPFPDERALQRLRSSWNDEVDVCMPTVGEHFEPLFAFYHPRCLPTLEGVLEHGHHRIARAFPSLRVVRVPFPDDSPFANINTLDDYLRARELVETGRRRPPGLPVARGRPAVVVVARGSCEHQTASGLHDARRDVAEELSRLGLLVDLVEREAQTDLPPPGSTCEVIVTTPDLATGHSSVAMVEICSSTGETGRLNAGPFTLTDPTQPSRRTVFDDAAGLAAHLVVRLDAYRGP